MKNYTVNCQVFIHKGKQYGKGETVPLSDAIAANQLSAGNVIDPAAKTTPTKETK
jgi:hypothetical protein